MLIFYLYVWMCDWMCKCNIYMPSAEGSQESTVGPVDWICEWLWPALWVLKLEFISSGRAATAPNLWTISPASVISVFKYFPVLILTHLNFNFVILSLDCNFCFLNMVAFCCFLLFLKRPWSLPNLSGSNIFSMEHKVFLLFVLTWLLHYIFWENTW